VEQPAASGGLGIFPNMGKILPRSRRPHAHELEAKDEASYLCGISLRFYIVVNKIQHLTYVEQNNLNSSEDKKILVVFEGGLGNQLFSYYAGVLASSLTDLPLLFDTSAVYLTHDRRGLTKFDLDIPSFQSSLPVPKALDPVNFRWIKYRKNKTLKAFPDVLTSIEDIENLRSPSSHRGPFAIVGHFQSINLLHGLAQQGLNINLRLKSPTRHFLELSQKAKQEQPIIIHFRRGDFRENPGWGLVNLGFYKRAVRQVTQDSNSPIWVFSDEPEIAQNLFSEAFGTRAETKLLPKRSSAAELLLLMSKGSALIMGNSTLSWWSGIISTGPVAVPIPFHPTRNDRFERASVEALKPRWISIPSTFELR